MNYLAIILGFVCIVLIYFIYTYLTNNALTSGQIPLSSPQTWNYEKLKNPGSLSFCYQLWAYVGAVPSSTGIKLFSRKSASASTSENEFTLLLAENTLSVKQNGQTLTTITSNFPIQKWVYIVINVSDQNLLEAYLNGKLVKTVQLSSNYKSPSNFDPLTLGDSAAAIGGYTTKFTRTIDVMSADAIWKEYLSGNGLSNFFSYFMPYNINMAISKDDIIQRQYKLI
jgi:hypothetical protein